MGPFCDQYIAHTNIGKKCNDKWKLEQPYLRLGSVLYEQYISY